MIRELCWLALLSLSALAYFKISPLFGLFGLVITVLEILREIGIFHEITFNSRPIEESTLYYYDYVGQYSKINTLFQKVCVLYNDKPIPKEYHKLVGLYYDDPEKTENPRASVGFLSTKTDLEDFFLSKGLKKISIPKTYGVSTILPFINMLSIIVYVKRYYPRLKQLLRDMSVFNLGISYPCVIEKYEEGTVEVILPLENWNEFRQPITKK